MEHFRRSLLVVLASPIVHPIPMSLSPATGFTNTTAVPLYWAAYGTPRSDPLLVLHGGPGAHHDYLLPQMLELAKHHRLIFYDQRGGGQSRDESREPITWQTHVADLAAVIGEFQLGHPTIVGYSWGGLLAMLYAIEGNRPGSSQSLPLPSRLILIDPAPAESSFRRAMESEFAARQQAPALLAKREELRASGLRDSNPEAYKKRLFELSVAGYFYNSDAARELTPFRVAGRIQDSVWRSLGDYDLLPSLRSLAIPALVLHGRDDPIPVQSSVKVADALGARLVLLEKCGHVPYVERPSALFSAMEGFLETQNAQKPE